MQMFYSSGLRRVFYGVVHRQGIIRRGMHNPMFPQKALPEIDFNDPNVKGKSKNDDDFLSKHGGKVFAACFAFVFGLLYRYIKSNSNRTKLEDALLDERAAEPIEINDARRSNPKFTAHVFYHVSKCCYVRFPSRTCSYPEFMTFVKETLQAKHGITIQSGHILDRVVLTKCMIMADASMNPGCSVIFNKSDKDNLDGSISSLQPLANKYFLEHQFSLTYLLVVLSMLVHERAGIRAELLFNTALLNENNSEKSETIESCSKLAVIDIVAQICETWQVPSDKKVIETGVDYPLKTFRLKEPNEMVDSYLSESKPPIENKESFNSDDFKKLLLSGKICAWGECHPTKH